MSKSPIREKIKGGLGHSLWRWWASGPNQSLILLPSLFICFTSQLTIWKGQMEPEVI